MIELTDEQHQTITAERNGLARAIDPSTKAVYVLVPAETFDHMQAQLSEDRNWKEGAYAAAAEVFARDGWDDPRMDVYDALGIQEIP